MKKDPRSLNFANTAQHFCALAFRTAAFLIATLVPLGVLGADLSGKTIEVYGTGGIGLKAWTSTCTGTYVNEADGSRGVVVSSTSTLCSGYNRWQIRWPGDATLRWSAEDWLRVVPPDLTIDGAVSVSPPSPAAGDTITVSCNIKNVGQGNAIPSGTKILLLRVSPFDIVTTIDAIETASVDAGATKAFSYSFALPSNLTPGDYRVSVEVDSLDSIDQVNFANDVTQSSQFPVVAKYNVTATAGSGGNIFPSGTISVRSGSDLDFTATPNAGYGVKEWKVDATTAQTGENSFRLSNITSDKSVAVSFGTLYRVTINVDGQGSYTLSPPGGSYVQGTLVTASATPAGGNQFFEWGGSQSSRSASFSFPKGGSDESVSLRFIPVITTPPVNTATAGTTPTTLGIGATTPPSWFTFFESSDQPFGGMWSLDFVVEGNGGNTVFEYTMSAGQRYMRTVYFPKVTTAPFLDFPIHDVQGGYNPTPRQAPVTVIFDHSSDLSSVRQAYVHDNAVRLTTGETFLVPLAHRVDGERYAPRNGAPLPTLFNYIGVAGQDGQANLQYDGHPGYDYLYSQGTDVYAAATGDIVTGGGADDCLAEGLNVAAVYMKHRHALILKHGNDYCTVYMHLSAIDSTWADTTDPNFWKPKAGTVTKGQHIGKVGNFLESCNGTPANPALGYHLHFEVWRKDGNTWYFADPYGYQWGSGPNFAIITPYLWTQLF